ncbi:hypothetical protein BDN72DRAFT_860554 [Pluteus cervinus]|uniref:Uncharacterized protein n=1 Tax=Pluteus cervinus TaxID=181527 RepID=A0ACD3AJ18_9AGAR|nr:hypothetical protein BDN72DRAFT_860554 [Pluteus cervinus]
MDNAQKTGNTDAKPLFQNSHQPFGQIPPDVLIKIFLLFLDDENTEKRTHSLLQLTWISNHWRNIALGCKGLWAYIDNSNYKWAAVWLDRSGDALLSVDLDKKSVRFGTHNLLNPVSHRLKSLHLRASGQVLSTWDAASPHLEHLALQSLQILEDSLQDHAATLRHLSLRNCTFHYHQVLTTFSGVTVLTVEHPERQLSPNSLLQLLQGMTRLVKLVLCRVFEEPDTAPNLIDQQRTSNLVYLQIEDYQVEACLQFIENFSLITEKTCVRVHLAFSTGGPPSLQTRLSAISQLHSSSARRLTSVKLGNARGYSPALIIEFSSTSSQGIPIAPARYVIAPAYVKTSVLLTALQGALDLSEVHTLRVHLPARELSALEAMQLASIFGPCPRIQCVDFQCSPGATSNFLASLASYLTGSSGTPRLVPFPALETYGVVNDPQLATLLGCALSFRIGQGCKLRTLVMGRQSATWPGIVVDEMSERVDGVIIEGSEEYLEFVDRQDEEDQKAFRPLEDDDGDYDEEDDE